MMEQAGTSQICRRGSHGGIRYITDELLRKLTGTNNLKNIITLSLTLAEGAGQIKYIENLNQFRRLQKLNLSKNCIERIDHLSHMTNLKELNISHNCLSRIEGLECLVKIQLLDLSFNRIKNVPKWLPEKLQALRVFKIQDNYLDDMSEFLWFRNLVNFVQLNVAGNSFTQLPHYKLYLVCHLRSLEKLDGVEVTSEQQMLAKQKFTQAEIDRLTCIIDAKENECSKLADSLKQSEKEVENRGKVKKILEEKNKEIEKEAREKDKKLETTHDILKKRTKDLLEANLKHFELEHNLAFYKINHKFDSLLQQSTQNGSPDSSFDTSSSPGECPYIGKALFKANMIALEGNHKHKPLFVGKENEHFPSKDCVDAKHEDKIVPHKQDGSTNIGHKNDLLIDDHVNDHNEEDCKSQLSDIELQESKIDDQYLKPTNGNVNSSFEKSYDEDIDNLEFSTEQNCNYVLDMHNDERGHFTGMRMKNKPPSPIDFTAVIYKDSKEIFGYRDGLQLTEEFLEQLHVTVNECKHLLNDSGIICEEKVRHLKSQAKLLLREILRGEMKDVSSSPFEPMFEVGYNPHNDKTSQVTKNDEEVMVNVIKDLEHARNEMNNLRCQLVEKEGIFKNKLEEQEVILSLKQAEITKLQAILNECSKSNSFKKEERHEDDIVYASTKLIKSQLDNNTQKINERLNFPSYDGTINNFKTVKPIVSKPQHFESPNGYVSLDNHPTIRNKVISKSTRVQTDEKNSHVPFFNQNDLESQRRTQPNSLSYSKSANDLPSSDILIKEPLHNSEQIFLHHTSSLPHFPNQFLNSNPIEENMARNIMTRGRIVQNDVNEGEISGQANNHETLFIPQIHKEQQIYFPEFPYETKKNRKCNVVVEERNILFCNIPQHLLLEQDTAMLKEKYKRLMDIYNEKRNHTCVYSTEEDGRKLQQLMKNLKSSWRNLDSLDLAIEHQKQNLQHVRRLERLLSERRSNIQDEIVHVMNSKSHKIKSPMDNWNFPNEQNLICNELACIESELTSKENELSKVNISLVAKTNELESIEFKLKKMYYEHGRISVAMKEFEEQKVEAVTQTNLEALKVTKLKCEITKLEKKKENLEKLFEKVEKIIRVRDGEFKDLEKKINLANKRLLELGNITGSTTQKDYENSDSLLGDKIMSQQEKLSKLLEVISKRKEALEEIEANYDNKTEQRISYLKDVENEINLLKFEKKSLIDCIENEQKLLKQVLKDLTAGEVLMNSLKSDSKRLVEEISEKKKHVGDATVEILKKSEDVMQLEDTIKEKKQFIDILKENFCILEDKSADLEKQVFNNSEKLRKLKGNLSISIAELKEMEAKISHGKGSIDTLDVMKNELETSMEQILKDRTKMVKDNEELNEENEEMLRRKEEVRTSLLMIEEQLKNNCNELIMIEKYLYEKKEHKVYLDNQLVQLGQEIHGRHNDLTSILSSIKDFKTKYQMLVQEVENLSKKKCELKKETNESMEKLIEINKDHDELLVKIKATELKLNETRIQCETAENYLQELKKEMEERSFDLEKLSSLEEKLSIQEKIIANYDAEKSSLMLELVEEKMRSREDKIHHKKDTEELESQLHEIKAKLVHSKLLLHEKTKQFIENRFKMEDKMRNAKSMATFHVDRVKKMSNEVSMMRSQYLELQHQLEISEGANNLVPTLRSFLFDMKEDLMNEIQNNCDEPTNHRVSCLKEFEENETNQNDLTENWDVLNLIPTTCKMPVDHQHVQQEMIKKKLKKRVDCHLETAEVENASSLEYMNAIDNRLSNVKKTILRAEVEKLFHIEHPPRGDTNPEARVD